jgi:hypothetical protein
MTQPFETGPHFPPSGMTGSPDFSGPHPMQGSDPCLYAGTAGNPGDPQASRFHQGPQMPHTPGMPDAGHAETCGCGDDNGNHGGCRDQTIPSSGSSHAGAGPSSPFPGPPSGPQPETHSGRNPGPYPGPSSGCHPGMGQAAGPGMNGTPFPGQGTFAPSGHPPGMPDSFHAMNGSHPFYSHYYGPYGMAPAQPMPHYAPNNPQYGYSGMPCSDFPGQAAGGPRPYGEMPGGHTPGGSHADHGPGHPKHNAHQYGQFMGLVNDLANGKADPSQVMSFLGGLDGQFLKGALVGIGTTLLLTSDSVRKGMAGTLSGVFDAFGKESREEQETAS